jgi:CheY-like chemotaxis protein
VPPCFLGADLESRSSDQPKIGHLSNGEIPQLPDAAGGLFIYTVGKIWSDCRNEVAQMRILVAEGQPRVRYALRVLLARQAGCEVVGETENAEELLIQTEATCPDVVLLGWELPGLSACDMLAALRKASPDVAVIVLSGWPDACRAALDAGADAFVSKADPPERLLDAIAGCGSR